MKVLWLLIINISLFYFQSFGQNLRPTKIPKIEDLKSIEAFTSCFGMSGVRSFKLRIDVDGSPTYFGNENSFNLGESTQFGLGCIRFPLFFEFSLSENAKNLKRNIVIDDIKYKRISLRINQSSVGYLIPLIQNIFYINIGIQDSYVEWSLFEDNGSNILTDSENNVLGWVSPIIVISNSVFFSFKWEKSFSSDSLIQSGGAIGIQYYRAFI